MITIETYQKFWDKDLLTIKMANEIEDVLSPFTIKFLYQFGLPTSERIFRERKSYLENTTPVPEIVLSPKNIERSIKSLYPYFEFLPYLSEIFEFQGRNFVRIGVDREDDIGIDTSSGNIHHINRNPPVSWPADFRHLVQNHFINSGVDKLGLFLTAEFLSRQERIKPIRKYEDAINSKNPKTRKESEKEIAQIIDNLEKEFIEIDNQALIATESYWRNYLIDMRN